MEVEAHRHRCYRLILPPDAQRQPATQIVDSNLDSKRRSAGMVHGVAAIRQLVDVAVLPCVAGRDTDRRKSLQRASIAAVVALRKSRTNNCYNRQAKMPSADLAFDPEMGSSFDENLVQEGIAALGSLPGRSADVGLLKTSAIMCVASLLAVQLTCKA